MMVSAVTNPASASRLLQRLAGQLRPLGLTVSLFEPSGQAMLSPSFAGEFCRLMCGQKKVGLEAMSLLAQRACQEQSPCSGPGPCGCCILAVPMRQRRKLAAAVACFLVRRTPESEELARVCSQVHLDQAAAGDLARQVRLHDEASADVLGRMLDWLIQDEQAAEVAHEELAMLSTNLATTYEELSLLYRISGSVKVNQKADEFFQNLCRELIEVMGLQAAAVVLAPRPHSDEAEQVVHAGQLPLTPAQLAQVVRRYLAPRLTAGKPIVDNQFAQHAAHLGAKVEQIRTLVAVPLLSGGSSKGVLVGINKAAGEFDSPDIKLASSLSGQAAVFLENHHLYQDLQDLLMGVLHALTASIDAKDPYTCGHSRRVAVISRRLAEMSGFDPHHAQRIYLAGLLHDIGKIGMPESVLCKIGRLDELEYQKVKRHPEVGAMILKGIRQLEDVVPAILHHHERVDGRGYPSGLAGREVPPEALIVGLADSFDAMTSCRTYRSAMPLPAVLAEIRRGSGTQFDPRAVEHLLSLDLPAFLGELREISTAQAEAFGVNA